MTFVRLPSPVARLLKRRNFRRKSLASEQEQAKAIRAFGIGTRAASSPRARASLPYALTRVGSESHRNNYGRELREAEREVGGFDRFVEDVCRGAAEGRSFRCLTRLLLAPYV